MKYTFIYVGVAVATRFFDDLPKNMETCTEAALHEIKERYPGLEECYSYSTLFLGSTSTVCSEKCLEITVQASKRVAEVCKLEAPSAKQPIMSNKERIYAIWGNHDAAKVVCAKHAARGLHCLDEFSRVSSQLALPQNLRTPNAVTRAKACNQCNKEMYDMFNANGYLMPVVYYQTVDDPTTTFRNLGNLCGYSQN